MPDDETSWIAGQAGETRAEYGKEIIDRFSADLTDRFGRGFGWSNLFQMRAFFLARRSIVPTASGRSLSPGTRPRKSSHRPDNWGALRVWGPPCHTR